MNLNTFLNSVTSSSSSTSSGIARLKPLQAIMTLSSSSSSPLHGGKAPPIESLAEEEPHHVARLLQPSYHLQNIDTWHLVPGKRLFRTWKRQSLRPSQPAIPPDRRSCGGRLLCHHHYNLGPRPFYHNNNNDNKINNKKEKT